MNFPFGNLYFFHYELIFFIHLHNIPTPSWIRDFISILGKKANDIDVQLSLLTILDNDTYFSLNVVKNKLLVCRPQPFIYKIIFNVKVKKWRKLLFSIWTVHHLVKRFLYLWIVAHGCRFKELFSLNAFHIYTCLLDWNDYDAVTVFKIILPYYYIFQNDKEGQIGLWQIIDKLTLKFNWILVGLKQID